MATRKPKAYQGRWEKNPTMERASYHDESGMEVIRLYTVRLNKSGPHQFGYEVRFWFSTDDEDNKLVHYNDIGFEAVCAQAMTDYRQAKAERGKAPTKL